MRLLAAACTALALAAPAAASASPKAITLIFTGDVMLGRGVAPLAVSHPADVFGAVALQLSSADLTIGNLESPLTDRPHDYDHGPNVLEARPASARLLVGAGFDAMAIANNHAGDAGPQTVPDTVRALGVVGLPAFGAGHNLAAAFTPKVELVKGVRVAFLSFDDTTEGPRATPTRAGVAWWDPARVRAAVTRARAEADVVVVGLHGGADYESKTDPGLLRLARLLSAWGADIVWGTGPHVVQPTEVITSPSGRRTVVATSLGNLLFDQHFTGTRTGELLEVLAGSGGVRAYRLGATAQEDSDAVDFTRWLPPKGNAAALGDGGLGDGGLGASWWTLARHVATASFPRPALAGFAGQVVAAAVGDVDGSGKDQLVVSFWRPYRRTDVNALIPRSELVDRRGLTSHLGLYIPSSRAEIWVAGTILRPIRRLAPCYGALAVAYTTLNGSAIVGTGAWRWTGFGFEQLPDLTGPGTPACADVDGDGHLDPVILRPDA